MIPPPSNQSSSSWGLDNALDVLQSPTFKQSSQSLGHDHEADAPNEGQYYRFSPHLASHYFPTGGPQKVGDFDLRAALPNQDNLSLDEIESSLHGMQIAGNFPGSPSTHNDLATSPDNASNHLIAHGPHQSQLSKQLSAAGPSNSLQMQDTKANTFSLSDFTPRASPSAFSDPTLRPRPIRSEEAGVSLDQASPVRLVDPPSRSRPIQRQNPGVSLDQAIGEYVDSSRKRTNTKAKKAKAKPVTKNVDAHFDTLPNVLDFSPSADSDTSATTGLFDSPVTKELSPLEFVPYQVGGSGVVRSGRYDTPPSSYDEADWAVHTDAVPNIVTTSAGVKVLPALYKGAEERRVGLMTKLLGDFPDYARLLVQVGRSPTFCNSLDDPRPIHVFVDMSNIMVGFHDSVKASRKIPVPTRIRRLHMSFANFSLIMERGRTAVKRVLVGSDRLPAITEAEKLGYEANILDRVHKLKYTTPRFTKSRKTHGATTSFASGPETAGAGMERWVEQGVDEILHLKILESIVDTDEPSTIVLATGDAAVAEYSGGFMRMVERALRRGWNVELVSFAQTMSNSYRNKEFRARWDRQFRIIELDRYVEELFE